MRIAPCFTADFPAAVILVQHMPAAFTTQYAAQLADFTGIRVKEAEAHESLQPGTLYICPGGQHLRVTSTGRIQLDGTSGRINGYLPNIDATMESVEIGRASCRERRSMLEVAPEVINDVTRTALIGY